MTRIAAKAVGQVQQPEKKQKKERVDLDAVEVSIVKLDLSQVKVTKASIWDRFVPNLKEPGDAVGFKPDEVTYASLQQAASRFRKTWEVNVIVHVDRKTGMQYLVVKEGKVETDTTDNDDNNEED